MNRQVSQLTRPLEIHAAARTGGGQSAELAVSLPWYGLAAFGGAEMSLDSACTTCEFSRYSYTEFGIGRYGRSWSYWVGVGRALSEADDRVRCSFFSSAKCFHFIEARSNLQRVFLQADRTWRKRWFGVSTSTRVSHVLSSRHQRLDTPYDIPGPAPTKAGAFEGAPTGLFVEPTAEIGFGPAPLRLVAQFGMSVVITGKTTFGYRPLSATVGLSTNLVPLAIFGLSR